MNVAHPPVIHSAIYQGNLRHRRFHPKNHEFSYESTLFYIDLDELPWLFSGVRGWSLNRKNLGCFYRSDYLGDPAISLKDAVQSKVYNLLGTCPQGAVRMLTNLRILGFCFNPVTLYYVFEPGADCPSVILAEVNNTPWNERHCYLVQCDASTGKAKENFEKHFHVSPFNPLDMHYRWVSSKPDAHLLVHMENHAPPLNNTDTVAVEQICHMDATLSLKRREWSASLLQRLLWLQPWAAIKIPCAIYWQAVRLFFKGVPVYSHQVIKTLHSDHDVELKTTGKKS
jgi:DUF1365 family protein